MLKSYFEGRRDGVIISARMLHWKCKKKCKTPPRCGFSSNSIIKPQRTCLLLFYVSLPLPPTDLLLLEVSSSSEEEEGVEAEEEDEEAEEVGWRGSTLISSGWAAAVAPSLAGHSRQQETR